MAKRGLPVHAPGRLLLVAVSWRIAHPRRVTIGLHTIRNTLTFLEAGEDSLHPWQYTSSTADDVQHDALWRPFKFCGLALLRKVYDGEGKIILELQDRNGHIEDCVSRRGLTWKVRVRWYQLQGSLLGLSGSRYEGRGWDAFTSGQPPFKSSNSAHVIRCVSSGNSTGNLEECF